MIAADLGARGWRSGGLFLFLFVKGGGQERLRSWEFLAPSSQKPPRGSAHTISPPAHPHPETHTCLDVPEVANSGPKDFAKMALMRQHGQKEQPGGEGAAPCKGAPSSRGLSAVTQQVGAG